VFGIIRPMKTIRAKGMIQDIIRIVLVAALMLLVPLVAMQFTDEVAWSLADFIVAGILLLGAGLVYELIARRVNPRYRAVIAVVLMAILLLAWAELAVGIFGTPFVGS
jgi:predicted PurR-regulated permease PerM